MKTTVHGRRPRFAYVGSYTTPERGGQGNGINVYRVDPRNGAFSHVQHLGGLENPSFLAIGRDGTRLYSVHGDRSEVNSFIIDLRSGQIAPLNRQPTGGYNPVHLAFDASGGFLAVCNYGSDSLAVFPVARDGSLLPYRTLTTVTGTLGPHRIQQRTMCVHHIPLDRQGRFFYVPCKGSDAVVAYRLDTRRRVLVEAARVAARPGAAPRHIDFHPTRPLAYVINELDSTLTTYRQDRRSGALTPLQTIPSTPAEFTAYSTGAEIWLDRAGRNVYVSNRGHDSIGVFGIDRTKGTLSPRQWVPTHGRTPRFFAFDPAERFLYVANQDSRSIVGYRVDRSGLLSPARIRVTVGSPACIVFSR
ncbi:MAG: lactonase family protein [Alphaproteobacteria bacterium]|nr:lactonase family protein [Alphaproteobacteria bacterium]